MSLAETVQPDAGRRRPARSAPDKSADGGASHSWLGIPIPGAEAVESFMRSPSLAIPRPGRPAVRLATDRVRAKPAIAPQVSMMIGMTAIGLGVWGSLFPRSVKRTLGVRAPAPVVRALFGAREMWSGYSLAGDPTRTEVLWARFGADLVDLAVLKSLSRPDNPKGGNARLALGFVLAVTALDLVTAVRMSTVKRNCA